MGNGEWGMGKWEIENTPVPGDDSIYNLTAWNFMELHGTAWKLMELNSSLCNCIQAYVIAYKLIELHAAL